MVTTTLRQVYLYTYYLKQLKLECGVRGCKVIKPFYYYLLLCPARSIQTRQL